MITFNIFMPPLYKKDIFFCILVILKYVGQSVELWCPISILPALCRTEFKLSTQVLGSKCLGLKVEGQTILEIDMMTVHVLL